MKFARRRDPVVADLSSPGEVATPPAATAPAGRIPVAFAGILDGVSLTVAIESRPGAIALATPSGELAEASAEAFTDQPGYLAARIALDAIAPGQHDVVLVQPGGKQRALWTPPLPPARPRIDGSLGAVHALARGDDGTLRVRSTTPPPGAVLEAVHADRAGLRLRLHGASEVVALLAADEDTVLATWGVTCDDEVGAQVAITADAVDGIAAQMARLVTGSPGQWVPIRRRANDLTEPGRGAPMPELYGEQDPDHHAGDDPRLRLRWSGQATLLLRVFARGDAEPADARTEPTPRSAV
ncbi:hypothetical protein [Nocardioides sp. R-C-SC26]|uniref:hypothetical protein n=1 Tax=Nocardioides sp. R-C-SC26 TaxID=2870414 RepID=UPI001E2E9170|nr:hypothetical protein [Nocardioides sp. R-C-SC26]